MHLAYLSQYRWPILQVHAICTCICTCINVVWALFAHVLLQQWCKMRYGEGRSTVYCFYILAGTCFIYMLGLAAGHSTWMQVRLDCYNFKMSIVNLKRKICVPKMVYRGMKYDFGVLRKSDVGSQLLMMGGGGV